MGVKMLAFDSSREPTLEYARKAEEKAPGRRNSVPAEASSQSESTTAVGEQSEGGGESEGEGGDGDDEPPSSCLIAGDSDDEPSRFYWFIWPPPAEETTEKSLWAGTRKAFMEELGKLPVVLFRVIVTAIVIAVLMKVFNLKI